MKLLQDDFTTATWRRYQQDVCDRIDELRKLNDNPHNDEVTTAVIRGRIAELKRMLDLAKEASSSKSTVLDESYLVDDDQ